MDIRRDDDVCIHTRRVDTITRTKTEIEYTRGSSPTNDPTADRTAASAYVLT